MRMRIREVLPSIVKQHTHMIRILKNGLALMSLACIATIPHVFGESPQDWKVLLKERQTALVEFTRSDGLWCAGVFVSEGGHVLTAIQPFLGDALPVVKSASDGAATSIDSVVALFPEKDLVLVKLKHHPRRWLEVSNKTMDVGNAVAFLVQDNESPRHSGVILAQRSVRRTTKIGFPFERVLAIGTRRPRQQPDGDTTLPKGSPLVDQGGRLCGVMNTFQVSEGQFLVEAHPLEAVADAISAAIQGDAKVTFPIPDAMNRMNRIVMVPEFSLAVEAHQKSEFEKALKHVDALLAKYPEDPVVRVLQLDILDAAGRDQERQELLETLSRAGSKVKFDPYELLDQRFRMLHEQRQWNQAIAAAHELVKHSPEDFPAPAANLARCYVSRGMESGNRDDLLSAEKWFKVAMEHGSDNISLLTSYEALLSQLQRWEEADQISARIMELEKIYQ